MKKLHSHFKSLSFLLLCITATAQSMEPENNNQLAPITWAQTYHCLSELLHLDVMPLIFSFHLYTSGIDYEKLPTLIKDSYESPSLFIKLVDKLLKLGNDTLVTELFERGFHHTNVSICGIRSVFNSTILHFAIDDGDQKSIKIILNIAGDKTWELLTVKSKCNGFTALQCAAYKNHNTFDWKNTPPLDKLKEQIEIIELLLDAAGERAEELMDIGRGGITAFYIASPEIKEVMKKYRSR